MASLSVLTLADIGRSSDGASPADSYRSVLGFAGEISGAEQDTVMEAIAEPPDLTGDSRVDALLAAMAEHVAFHHDIVTPRWCLQPDRFLDSAWFPVDLASIRVRALISSPASFGRRCIFTDRSDLDRV